MAQQSTAAWTDDDLSTFAADGPPPLPVPAGHGFTPSDGAQIWHAVYGSGPAVILLHGGLGHSGNWGLQVPALVAAGYQVIVLDSRGHGRSTRDARPYSYELMAGDVRAVMDALGITQAALVGWSDGACTALVLADQHPQRVAGVFFFACNMDPSGAKAITDFPIALQRCYNRHVQDYQHLSPTPDQFAEFAQAVETMQKTQPNYSAHDLAQIRVPVTIVLGEYDEFIKRDHATYLAETIPGATFVLLPGVSHFAPLQRPALFNATVLAFLARVWE